MKKSFIKIEESLLTSVDVMRALASGLQNVPIDLNSGEVVYPTETKQAGNKLIVECTDGSVISLAVEVESSKS